MEHYSIFGSNTDNEYLLKLQNNESNIKIDIHNRDHNFTIDYVSSNEIITEYNTLGLKDITRIDENNYIHKSISNSSSNIIHGQYDGNQNDINNIYFSSIVNLPISETLSVTAYSGDYFDSNAIRVTSDYNEYIATDTYNRLTSAQQDILDDYTFYDNNLAIIEKANLNGALLHINFTNKNNVSGYQFFGFNTANKGVFPHKIKFYQVFDKNAYFFYEKTFDTYDKFKAKYNIDDNSFVSDELIIQVESVLIDDTYFEEEQTTITGIEQENTDEVFIFSGDYRLAMRFNGIQLFTTNERLINEYDIDMSNNSIQNVNTLTVDKLILNNVIYTDVVSSNRVLETVNEVISSDDSIKSSIVNGFLKDNSITLNSLVQTFNPARITDIESNIRSNLDTKYIPYVYTRYDDASVIEVEYDSNVNIKYLLNLSDLELDNTDKLMKHSNGIIYKENKVDNLEITSNLTILSNLEVKGNININSNILKWNNDIDKFTHLDGKIIQDDVIDMLSYEPKINKYEEYTISFNTDYDAFTLTYSNNDKQYYIRHPFNFVLIQDTSGRVENVESIYSNSLYSIQGEDDSFDCNLKIQFLDLNAKLNLYISSRFGNKDNLTQEASRSDLTFVSLTDNPEAIESSRPRQLIYSNNEYSSNYYDYYEYEVPEKVLLKQISFYDIEFEDYDNLLKNYYQDIINNLNIAEITDIDAIPDLYTYTAKNYLNNFAIIGYDNEWELIQHITFEDEKTVNQYKIQNINSNKKYSRYRIALKDSTDSNLPFIIKDLKFHVEYTKNNKNILYNGDSINFNIVNTLSINNSIRWNDYFNEDDKIRTKLIINEDQPSIKDYYDLSATADTIPYAVCHINENVDDSNLLENHMLKFGLFNNDVPLPSVDYATYSLSKNTPSVYHSLHLMNSNLYYTQSVINNFQNIKESDYHNEFLILVENKLQDKKHTGVVGINIDKTSLSNIINDTDSKISAINGLIVNPMMRLCAFNYDVEADYTLSSYMDIALSSNLTIENSYKIILPDNSSNITATSAYYLKPSANHTNRTITTQWATLGSEVFSKPDIFIGKEGNSNIKDKGFTRYSNTNKDTNVATEEHLTHIRKLLVGYPDDLNLVDINSNVLTVGGSVYATHDVSTDSDISYKYNLEKIEDARYKVEQLNGYTFDRNDTSDNRRYCGLIAQEIEKVIPEVIVKKHDGKMRVLYNNLAGLFVECFKDLYKEIDELKKEVRSHKVGL
jgi:hypothetical protein